MAIKFRLPDGSSVKTVKTIYQGNRRVCKVIFKDEDGTEHTPYILVYPVESHITNGSATGSSVEYGDIGHLDISSNNGYLVPLNLYDFTVTGGTATSFSPIASITGFLNFKPTKGTDKVTITATCPLQITTPSISLSSDTLSITDNSSETSKFLIYVDNVPQVEIDKSSS